MSESVVCFRVELLVQKPRSLIVCFAVLYRGKNLILELDF